MMQEIPQIVRKIKQLAMQLDQAKSGQSLNINEIPSELKSNLIRLGICEGDRVLCASKIPGGPVVLQKDLQEIAIGNSYAKLIKVEQCKS